jgi:hypothetical protein
MDEEAVGATDNIVTEFASYEDFLDSQITPLDLYYLEVGLSFFLRKFEEIYQVKNLKRNFRLKLQVTIHKIE